MSMKTLAIKIFYGDQLVDTKTLDQDVIKIGKLKSSHLCLDDEAVARMHAVIEVSGDEVRIIDLGSSSGTLLNGQRVDKNAPLGDGDRLEFGPYRVEIGFVVAQPIQAAPVAAAAAPMMAAAAPMPARAPIQIDASEFEVQNGSRVAEVVAMYGSTVLDVQHVGQIKNRRKQAPLWLAIGGAMMLFGVGIFGYEVSQDWEDYNAKVIEASQTGGMMPTKPGTGLGGLGVALAMFGLIPFGLGMTRMGDYVSPDFTIGEGHGASFHVPPAGLPNPSGFPLVRGSDHDFTLNFTQGMNGEVTLDGQTVPLAQLVSSGRAAAAGSHYSFPLPPGGSCRVG